MGLLILSLHHDGLLACALKGGKHKTSDFWASQETPFPETESKEDLQKLSMEICKELSENDFSSWAKYLLEEPIELAPKRVIYKGKVFEL